MNDQKVKIGIYLSDIDPANGGPIFEDGYPYTKAHPQLYELLTKHGAQVILVHDRPRTYKGKGIFGEWWEPLFEDEKLVSYKLHQEEIKISFLYDKSRFGAEEPEMYVLNPLEICDICSNKMETYKLIPDLHPKTELANTQQELDKSLNNWPDGQKVVIKSVQGKGGNQVYIGDVKSYTSNLELPVILQKYVETSAGVPGLVEGRHDVRVGLYNNQVLYALIRKPKKGEYRANIAQGGEAIFINPNKLPTKIVEIAKDVDKKFDKYPERFIAVDFVYSGDEWKVMELNSWPGLNDAELSQETFNYMNDLAKNLVKSARKFQ